MSEISMRITSTSDGDINLITGDLERKLKENLEDIKVVRVRESEKAQDLGSILSLAFDPSVITVISNLIANFLSNYKNSEIEVYGSNGERFIFKGRSSDAVKVAEALKSIFNDK